MEENEGGAEARRGMNIRNCSSIVDDESLKD